MTTVDTVVARVRQYAVRAVVTTSKVRIRVAVGVAAAKSALPRRLRPP
ncbi:hypothetical protein ABZ342_10420 [Amycolatopsis sp. NPDC005961]|uniref:Uncharacterized protein n=1 Tax=Amycolatopsis camponoti TaxID=2606593 RepID=A0A6I8M4H9_9PSEU|nr:hypothetical protein [Amycolatopsis camponoti]VVJ22440.1 Uncharacterised protein [Amycolatopsis camponoti]